MDGVDPIRGPGLTALPGSAATAAPKPGGPGAGSFAARAAEALQNADQMQKSAEEQATELAAGRGSTVETMVALSKADLSLRLVVALRNRALQAYEELMRMQV